MSVCEQVNVNGVCCYSQSSVLSSRCMAMTSRALKTFFKAPLRGGGKKKLTLELSEHFLFLYMQTHTLTHSHTYKLNTLLLSLGMVPSGIFFPYMVIVSCSCSCSSILYSHVRLVTLVSFIYLNHRFTYI